MGQYFGKEAMDFWVNSVETEDGETIWRTTIAIYREWPMYGSGREVRKLPKRVRAQNFEETRKGVREVLDECGYKDKPEEEYLEWLRASFEDAWSMKRRNKIWDKTPVVLKQ